MTAASPKSAGKFKLQSAGQKIVVAKTYGGPCTLSLVIGTIADANIKCFLLGIKKKMKSIQNQFADESYVRESTEKTLNIIRKEIEESSNS